MAGRRNPNDLFIFSVYTHAVSGFSPSRPIHREYIIRSHPAWHIVGSQCTGMLGKDSSHSLRELLARLSIPLLVGQRIKRDNAMVSIDTSESFDADIFRASTKLSVSWKMGDELCESLDELAFFAASISREQLSGPLNFVDTNLFVRLIRDDRGWKSGKFAVSGPRVRQFRDKEVGFRNFSRSELELISASLGWSVEEFEWQARTLMPAWDKPLKSAF